LRGLKAGASDSFVAVSRDGSTLLVTDSRAHCIHEFKTADGSQLRVVGKEGAGKLQFNKPQQVCIATDDDDAVLVAEEHNHRVQVLTPGLKFRGFVGVGLLKNPAGVCANADVVVVSEREGGVGRSGEGHAHRISVFSRGDGALLRRFGCQGGGDGQLAYPLGLCFTSGDRHIAVADMSNHRVCVFSVDGEFVRHVGVGELEYPQCVAASAFDELVVADAGLKCVVLFGVDGSSRTMGDAYFTGVAIHGGTIVAHNAKDASCSLFK
jgi:sugar lactone lactonase YvrE